MRDSLMPLIAAGTTQTASTTGTALDLLKGTNIQQKSLTGTDLLGAAGLHSQIAVIATLSGVTGTTPTLVFTVQQSDDNSTYTALSTSASYTANGDVVVPINPTKRYLRLDTTIGGTTPSYTIDAFVGTRPY